MDGQGVREAGRATQRKPRHVFELGRSLGRVNLCPNIQTRLVRRESARGRKKEEPSLGTKKKKGTRGHYA